MFQYFPIIDYDIDNDGVPIKVTNIVKRFRLVKALENKAVVLTDYQVRERERPDIVAQHFYGDYKLDWLVLLTNQILDPHFEWYMSYYEFRTFLIAKYGSLEAAQTTTHHREKIIQAETERPNGFTIPERTVIVDATTYSETPDSERKLITDYEYERDLNESRRNIKLIKKDFLPQITREAESIFNAG